VADVRPFHALVYDEDAAGPLGRLVAPPYDVISPEQRARLLEESPYNAVRLILPEVPYEEVGRLMGEWRAAGVLRTPDAPLLVAWTQAFTLDDGIPRERRTLLATVGLEPYEARVVRPHERTHAGPRADRLRLTRAVGANLSPVFGLYPDPEGRAWAAVASHVSGPPDAEVTDPEGTVHRFWTIQDAAAGEAVSAALSDRWILIADGHHRYETALAYREEVGGEGPHDRVLMGLTALEDPGLVVLPTHRVLAEWPPAADGALPGQAVRDLDELHAALAAAPEDAPAFGVVTAAGARVATLAPEDGDSPAARLDTAVLERRVLVPALGADQTALTARGVLSYTKDASEAWRRVAAGEAAGAVILRDIPKAAVAEVAEAGEVMPQKSTYFFPKLLTGVAFHPLDGRRGG
jgi:uncharacterized protein (DUF1015 family)